MAKKSSYGSEISAHERSRRDCWDVRVCLRGAGRVGNGVRAAESFRARGEERKEAEGRVLGVPGPISWSATLLTKNLTDSKPMGKFRVKSFSC